MQFCDFHAFVFNTTCHLNAFRIIAVSYEARDFGVSRSMRGDDAKAKCPEIILVPVPQVRGKADLTKYAFLSALLFHISSIIT